MLTKEEHETESIGATVKNMLYAALLACTIGGVPSYGLKIWYLWPKPFGEVECNKMRFLFWIFLYKGKQWRDIV